MIGYFLSDSDRTCRRNPISLARLFPTCIFILSMLAFIPNIGIAYQKDKLNDTSPSKPLIHDDGSYFESTIANYEAWNSGDVLFKVSKTFDTVRSGANQEPIGVLVTEEVYCRLVFDYSKCKLAVFRSDSKIELDMASTAENKTGPVVTGVILNGLDAPILLRQFPHRLHRRPHQAKTTQEALIEARITDLRGLGIVPLPYYETFVLAKERSLKYRNPDNIVSSQETAKQMEITVKTHVDEHGDEFQRKFQFNLQSLMPEHQAGIVRFKKPRGGHNYGLNGKAWFDWKAIDGVNVPIEVTSELGRSLDVMGAQHDGTQQERIEFHWFSLNQPVEERFFKADLLNDLESVIKLVDPKLAGATTLLSPNQ